MEIIMYGEANMNKSTYKLMFSFHGIQLAVFSNSELCLLVYLPSRKKIEQLLTTWLSVCLVWQKLLSHKNQFVGFAKVLFFKYL